MHDSSCVGNDRRRSVLFRLRFQFLLTLLATLFLLGAQSSWWVQVSHAKPSLKRLLAQLPQLKARERWAKTVPAKFQRPTKRAPIEVSAAMAAKMINPGDNVFLPVGHSVASSVVDALAELVKTGKGGYTPETPVHLVGLTNTSSRKVFDRKGCVQPRSLFIGANARDAVSRGTGDFVPIHFSRVPDAIREGHVPVDTALIQVSPPDKKGFVTLGSTTSATLAALEKAKLVIAEVNPNVPRTYGAARIHKSRIDVVVHDDKPLRALPEPPLDNTSKAIAKHVVGLLPEGKKPTMQFGIGAIPNAVAAALAKTGRKVRVHSEMISDGVRMLDEAGVVEGKINYTFAFGSEKMLRWMDGNRKLQAGPVDYVNERSILAQQKRLVAVNGALEVDLHGQINAQMRDGEMYSGVGGQVDFLTGAAASKGGIPITALPATAEIKNKAGKTERITRIVPRLPDGVVTTSLNDAGVIVTEYGTADLRGKSEDERAEALIAIAAPEYRPQLRKAWAEHMKVRQGAEKKRYDAFMQRKEEKE